MLEHSNIEAFALVVFIAWTFLPEVSSFQGSVQMLLIKDLSWPFYLKEGPSLLVKSALLFYVFFIALTDNLAVYIYLFLDLFPLLDPKLHEGRDFMFFFIRFCIISA